MPSITDKHVLKRVQKLNALELDYFSLKGELDHFTRLAVTCTGAYSAVINLLDEHNQWTVSACGMEHNHMPKDKSICQFTIQQKEPYEITDLRLDSRFTDSPYLAGDPVLTYYLGIPILTTGDVAIGALCILNVEPLSINSFQIQQLQLIAEGITKYLERNRDRKKATEQLYRMNKYLKKLAHDIRSPISAIVTTTELLETEEDPLEREELRLLIKESAETILEYTEDQLSSIIQSSRNSENKIEIDEFLSKLHQLYVIQSNYKNITLRLSATDSIKEILLPISSASLIHIVGNLISNSIKYTARGGNVWVHMDILIQNGGKYLGISVRDNGIGMDTNMIDQIKNGNSTKSRKGTSGENGFGIGLSEAFRSLNEIGGQYHINSTPKEGTDIDLLIPI